MLVLVRVRCSNGSAGNPGGIAMHEDKHKAPTHLRIRPLSLQNAGAASVPMGVMTLFDWKNSLGASAKRSGARITTSRPSPIYRPGERIDGPLADKSAVRQYIVRLRRITDPGW